MSYTKGELKILLLSDSAEIRTKDDKMIFADMVWWQDRPLENDANEFVRRWNAFEKGGLVDNLLAACKRYVRGQEEVYKEMGKKPTSTTYQIKKEVIAKAKKE